MTSLRTTRDFRRVRRTGRRARSNGVTVIAAAGSGPEGRLGISIPAAGGIAVERNRARRRIKEIMSALAGSDGLDVIVQARRDAVGLSFQELAKHIEGAYGQVAPPGRRS